MFNEVKKKLGFGCMRLPMKDGEVELNEFKQMVDTFIDNGFNYFDTAHTYINGKSEPAIKEALTSRYPRDKYILTDKLSNWCFEKEEDLMPLFQSQLDACGVDYFDFYLMHAMNTTYFERYKKLHVFDFAFGLKEKGLVKHVGFSFHDTPEVLDRILTEYPELEVVQLQINYIDFDDPSVQARKCYEVCVKHNKPVIVMEPVKGGNLVNLPPDARKIFDEFNNGSYASYAIRFAASLDNVFMVLSGMSNNEQMEDNISYMKEFKKLSPPEEKAVKKVCDILTNAIEIPCTGCEYCKKNCPQNIPIPELFAFVNQKAIYDIPKDPKAHYERMTSGGNGAGSCIKCGSCEELCPQKLPIRELLEKIARKYER